MPRAGLSWSWRGNEAMGPAPLESVACGAPAQPTVQAQCSQEAAPGLLGLDGGSGSRAHCTPQPQPAPQAHVRVPWVGCGAPRPPPTQQEACGEAQAWGQDALPTPLVSEGEQPSGIGPFSW